MLVTTQGMQERMKSKHEHTNMNDNGLREILFKSMQRKLYRSGRNQNYWLCVFQKKVVSDIVVVAAVSINISILMQSSWFELN